MPYRIAIPGTIYTALRERNALENQNPTDEAAFAIFKKAVPQRKGNGYRYVVTGEKEVVKYILDYLDSLLGLAEDRIVPAYEFGTDIKTLRRVVLQRPERTP